jgi:hypothetical protein
VDVAVAGGAVRAGPTRPPGEVRGLDTDLHPVIIDPAPTGTCALRGSAVASRARTSHRPTLTATAARPVITSGRHESRRLGWPSTRRSAASQSALVWARLAGMFWLR